MGYIGDIQSFYEMSQEWYAGRMDEDWEPFTPEEATSLWARHGFTGDFWSLT